MSARDQQHVARRPRRTAVPVNLAAPAWPRIREFFLRGKDCYDADRFTGDAISKIYPGLPACTIATQILLRRSVEQAARDGISQFLDLAGGYPNSSGDIHYIASRFGVDPRVVYVESDPIVASHTRAYLDSRQAAAFIEGDLEGISDVLDEARDLRDHDGYFLLDLSKPIAVLLGETLERIEDAAAAVQSLTDAIAPGSQVILTHLIPDEDGVMDEMVAHLRVCGLPLYPRSPQEITDLLAGIALQDPGVALIADHLHEDSDIRQAVNATLCVAAVGTVGRA